MPSSEAMGGTWHKEHVAYIAAAPVSLLQLLSGVAKKKFNELGPSAFCFGTCCCRADERRPVAPE